MTDTVTAHHDYEAQQDDELSFVTGDIIKVTDHSNADWWLGTKQDGSSGYFPSNFVEATSQEKETEQHEETTISSATAAAATPPPVVEERKDDQQEVQERKSIGMARVMEDYAMQQENELTLHKGDIVELYERSDDGWLHGEINGKQGRFPAKYVEDIDMPGRPDLGTSSRNSDDSAEGGKAPAAGFKLAAFGVKQGGIGSLLAGGIPTLKKTGNTQITKSPEQQKQPPQQQEEVSSPQVSSPTKISDQSAPVDNAEKQAATQSTVTKDLGKAIVLHPYDAENEDELNLIRGEYIDILDRHADDGWWQGRNERNQSGVFPSNFVKEIEQDQQQPVMPVRSRKSVASTPAIPPAIPVETRPFSTPITSSSSSSSFQQHAAPRVPVQRLPPLPDTQPVPTSPTTPPTVPEEKELEKEKEKQAEEPVTELPKQKKDDQTAPEPAQQPAIPERPKTSDGQSPVLETARQQPAIAERPEKEEHEESDLSVSQDIPDDADIAEKEKVSESPIERLEEISHIEAKQIIPSSSPTAASPNEDIATKDVHVVEEEDKGQMLPSSPISAKDNVDVIQEATSREEKVSEEQADQRTEEVPPATEQQQEKEEEEEKQPSTTEETEVQEDTKKAVDLSAALPATGPRLTLPSRTARPSNRSTPRRPPTREDSPSQTELLQQELEKTPEEEKPTTPTEQPASPPPKPVKPIFAKFPTPFAMGGGGGDISTKNLKPVQRRMFEPAPAHESSATNNNNDDKTTTTATATTEDQAPARPTPGGVRGLASRFAGIPNTGGGNEVLETKLKNFTKNEVEKVRKEFEKELASERAQREQLEDLVQSLMATVQQLQQQ